jgi:uncharacterized protein
MKFLVVAFVVILGFWLWKKNRADDASSTSSKAPAPPDPHKKSSDLQPPQLMLRCAHCGVHMPQTDAVPGRQGSYCSLAHRQQGES